MYLSEFECLGKDLKTIKNLKGVEGILEGSYSDKYLDDYMGEWLDECLGECLDEYLREMRGFE